MSRYISYVLVFVTFSMVQVRIVDAKDYTIPTEDPKDCIKRKALPCSITTGDKPRMFEWDDSIYELDREIVINKPKQKKWNLYSGMIVIDSRHPQEIHTPFADIHLGNSKVLLHVLENKVRVLSLSGEGVMVQPKGHKEEQFLVPGFQNWFGGVVDGQAETGVVSVINFESYSKNRARFFMNHQLGFLTELNQVASTVKWAAQMASEMHRKLVERKMASLEEDHQDKIYRKRKKVEYNQYLRRLFLKKVRYDY